MDKRTVNSGDRSRSRSVKHNVGRSTQQMRRVDPSLPLPELLAPAGSPAALAAAVLAGADAVYLGGTMHNARMNAKNFTEADIATAISDCHRVGVRIYVTMNTLLWDRELPDALAYAVRLYEMGVDALIVADLGFAALLHHYLPDLPLHASTQMSAHNSEMAKVLSELGFVRMVCARELPREDVELLVKRSPIEIEQFVHGALCVSHSGQCLASAMIGGRSGNRGACAQPCRMRYNGGYPLSLKDLSLARHVPALIESGVHSLKIEGRMKSPAYVQGVVSVWRRLLDERRGATEAELAQLAALFSRSGFTDGYYLRRFAGMCGVRTDADKQATRTSNQRGVAYAQKRRAPIHVVREKVTLPTYAVDAFFSHLSDRLSAPIVKDSGVTASFYTAEQIPSNHDFDHVELPLAQYAPVADGVRLPAVIFDRELAAVENMLTEVAARGVKRARVTNLGQLAMVRRAGMDALGDLRLNATNSLTCMVLAMLGFTDWLISPELTLPRIRDLRVPRTVPVYGKIPMMLLERDPGASVLKDRMGATFSVKKEGGRFVVHNAVPLYMCDRADALKAARVHGTYYLFSDEKEDEVQQVLRARRSGEAAKGAVRRIPQK